MRHHWQQRCAKQRQYRGVSLPHHTTGAADLVCLPPNPPGTTREQVFRYNSVSAGKQVAAFASTATRLTILKALK